MLCLFVSAFFLGYVFALQSFAAMLTKTSAPSSASGDLVCRRDAHEKPRTWNGPELFLQAQDRPKGERHLFNEAGPQGDQARQRLTKCEEQLPTLTGKVNKVEVEVTGLMSPFHPRNVEADSASLLLQPSGIPRSVA